jgi:hypothetical protein
VFDEGCLQWTVDAFDRGHLAAVVLDGQRQARQDTPAVGEHRARAAAALVAALLRAGEPELLTQRVEQAGAGVDVEVCLDAVHPH